MAGYSNQSAGNQIPYIPSGNPEQSFIRDNQVAIHTHGLNEVIACVHSGGAGLIVNMVSFTVTGGTVDTTAPTFTFHRFNTPGNVTGRAVTFNAGDGTGATPATIPIGAIVGNVYRVWFGGDADSDHVLNPGEQFGVKLTTVAGGSDETVMVQFHCSSFEVGPSVDVNGGAHTDAMDKENANGVGKIYNVIS